MVENNTRDLELECERLALFFGPGTVLHTETIAQYIYHSKEENVFTLFEKLAERDLAASQEILTKILLSKESDPTSLMGGLLWQIRKLIDLKRLMEENYSSEEAFSRINIKGKRRRAIYLAAHEAYSLIESQALISLVAEFDVRLRSFKTELHTVLMQLFLYYAIVRGGRMPIMP
jgi:DNA polymerase-3 subunit delta